MRLQAASAGNERRPASTKDASQRQTYRDLFMPPSLAHQAVETGRRPRISQAGRQGAIRKNSDRRSLRSASCPEEGRMAARRTPRDLRCGRNLGTGLAPVNPGTDCELRL